MLKSAADIVHLRLRNQHLAGEKFDDPAITVSAFGAMQAQEYTAATWAVGMRTRGSSNSAIDEAFNAGHILRTHVMRPTWHFVAPSDIRWLQGLTAHRVHTINGTMYRQLELSDAVLKRTARVIQEALRGGRFLTRNELAQELERHGITAIGQRLAYIVMHAELSALICSGPRRGKQFTYALLEERAPEAKSLGYEEALATLALTYFTSHGPAQAGDFAWWSGLTVAEANAGLELTRSRLAREVVDKKTYWFAAEKRGGRQQPPRAFLLSVFDEYIIAYKDRGDIAPKSYQDRMAAMGNALRAVILIDGRIAGTWRRELRRQHVDIELDLFRLITSEEEEAINRAAQDYGDFLGLPVGSTSFP